MEPVTKTSPPRKSKRPKNDAQTEFNFEQCPVSPPIQQTLPQESIQAEPQTQCSKLRGRFRTAVRMTVVGTFIANSFLGVAFGESQPHLCQYAVAIEVELTAKSQERYQEILREYSNRQSLALAHG